MTQVILFFKLIEIYDLHKIYAFDFFDDLERECLEAI